MNKRLFIVVLGVLLLIAISATVVKGDSYVPVVAKDSNITAIGPTHVLYVFSTTATTTGYAGGLPGMNAICTNEDMASHFCSTYEIENAMATSGVYFKSPFQEAWVNNPTLSLIPLSNNSGIPVASDWTGPNCLGWGNQNTGNFGRQIDNDVIGFRSRGCDQLLHVTCCKWNP